MHDEQRNRVDELIAILERDGPTSDAFLGGLSEANNYRLELLEEHGFEDPRSCHPDRLFKWWKFLLTLEGKERAERAHECLLYIASHCEDYGHEEAIIYLISRGVDCRADVTTMSQRWKADAQAKFSQAKKRKVWTELYASTSDWSNVPTNVLPYFWETDYNEDSDSIDATILRAADWCNVGELDRWIERLIQQEKANVKAGYLPWDDVGICWLFNICRSDLALELMKPELERALESLETSREGLVSNDGNPWRMWRDRRKSPKQVNAAIRHAATIAFADHRIRSSQSEMSKRALSLLVESSHEGGGWCKWDDGGEPDVLTTAMVMHALALGQPRGWQRVSGRGADWLASVQTECGVWELGSLEFVFLTVLALDAIELASEGKNVTFRLGRDNPHCRYLDIDVDVVHLTVRRDGESVEFGNSKNAWSLFCVLHSAADEGMEREALFEAVWPNKSVLENNLDQYKIKVDKALARLGLEIVTDGRVWKLSPIS